MITGLKAAASGPSSRPPWKHRRCAPQITVRGVFFACLKGTMLPSPSPKAAADNSAHEPSIFYQPPPSNSEPRVVYYSVFFDNDVYKGTRQSAIIETCETQQFIPVNLSPPPAPPKSPQSANNNWVSRVVCVSPRFVQARCLREAGFQLE